MSGQCGSVFTEESGHKHFKVLDNSHGSTVLAGYAQKDFAVKHSPPLPMVCIDCKETQLTPLFC